MLFAAKDGRPEHPVEDSTEVDVVQRLACGIGPNVDGMSASRSLPQAMGAFITYGAQGACAGRDQQAEQHAPTTFQPGLGQAAALAPTSTSPLSPTTTSQTMLTKAIALRTAISPTLTTKPTAVMAPAAAPAAPAAPTPAPDASAAAAATPHPPGTITAFSTKLNMWRVAFPVGAAPAAAPTGLGIFSAAATFVEQAPQAAPNPGDTQVPEKELEAKTGTLPFYKKPLFWIAVAGGVAVLGGGTFFLVRRRRKAKAAAPAPALPKAAYY